MALAFPRGLLYRVTRRGTNRAKGMTSLHTNDARRFCGALRNLETDPRVTRMKDCTQHKGNTTYSHCHSVALSSFRLAQWLGWRIDEPSLARGAMLHDFHLYTRRKHDVRHLFRHPRLALANAEAAFALNDKERNIIASHMWPLTLTKLPRSREAVLVMLADKYCACREMAAGRARRGGR